LVQFFDVMFRSLAWTNVNDTEVNIGGINLYRFLLPPTLFDNKTRTPANAAYFANGPNGFMNITGCTLHSMSYHFFLYSCTCNE
jgi:hypothetical protein